MALGLDFKFYNIDEDLNPIPPRALDSKTVFLYVNYFGIKQKTVDEIAR